MGDLKWIQCPDWQRASTMGPSYPLRIAHFDPAQEKNYMYGETSI